jgi:uncharacterized protein (DUF1697 family)
VSCTLGPCPGLERAPVTVFICMLRGINVGRHNRIKMDALRGMFESAGLRGAQTYVQSGNVIFRSEEADAVRLANKIENAIEQAFGIHSSVILRTAAEMRDVIARNPFAARNDLDPSKFLVNFLSSDPGQEIRDRVNQVKTDPEELRMSGRELYIYFPDGMARPKLPMAMLEKMLKTAATGRNWNSVTKMLEIAEKLERTEDSL